MGCTFGADCGGPCFFGDVDDKVIIGGEFLWVNGMVCWIGGAIVFMGFDWFWQFPIILEDGETPAHLVFELLGLATTLMFDWTGVNGEPPFSWVGCKLGVFESFLLDLEDEDSGVIRIASSLSGGFVLQVLGLDALKGQVSKV